MSDLPNFINYPGNVIVKSPLNLTNSNMNGFFIKGKRDKLQVTVDQCLNGPASGKMKFKVLSEYVMLTFTSVEHAQTANPVDKQKGFMKEVDIITWIMVGSMVEKDGKEKIDHLYFYPHFVFVDNAMAQINGRELFGYNKFICDYYIPGRDQKPDKFTCSVDALQPFSVDTKLAHHKLMEVTMDSEGTPSTFESIKDFFEDASKLLWSNRDLIDLDKEGLEQLISLAFKPAQDQIFLKQFPDSSGSKAVYQAILQAPANVTKFHSGTLLNHKYKLNLHQVDSFPLAEALGFEVGEQDVILPFNVFFDFQVTAGSVLVDNSRVKREKIAILGGGVSAMTSAFYLTSKPGWQDKYDITVYQQGWRIGGKGASGRNQKLGNRIEEHGLHIFFGFYENAFKTMRAAYGELNPTPDCPFQTWEDAFKRHSFIVQQEKVGDEWLHWPYDFPSDNQTPGHSEEQITVWEMFYKTFLWVKQWLKELRVHAKVQQKEVRVSDPNESWLGKLVSHIKQDISDIGSDIETLLDSVTVFLTSLPKTVSQLDKAHIGIIETMLLSLRKWLQKQFEEFLDTHTEIRRLFIVTDLGITILLGMIKDGVVTHGFDVINQYDFREWLTMHGANQKYSVNSPPITGSYDLYFANKNGDWNTPNIEAGSVLRAMMLVAFGYKGAVMWKMQAGMGDTIFTPFYKVLKDRGVKFEYFNQVDELIPKGDEIAEIRITEQVALKDNNKEYQPLIDVKHLDCWPSEPLYGQIDEQQAKLLEDNKIDLEDYWTNWPEVYEKAFNKPLPQKSLVKGKDFDTVIFGISIAAIPNLCQRLECEKLDLAVEHIQAIPTQAFQVWMGKTLEETGWDCFPPSGEGPVLSTFVDPYDTYASMSQLLDKETWPAELEPKSVQYFCSTQPVFDYPPRSVHEFPARMKAVAKEGAINYLKNDVHWLWPDVAGPGKFAWQTLIDPQQQEGESRFDSQYWRSNVSPSERYVLTLQDTSKYRIETDQSKYSNLYFTGDWIKNGLNVGCVEAAVMAGMQTSQSICGVPSHIYGEEDKV